MDLSVFVLLWVAYLQLHDFVESTQALDATDGVTWTCKHDSTKTIHLLEQHATLATSSQRWDIFIREEDIVCIDKSFEDDVLNQYGARTHIFRDFGSRFEVWLADAFESVKCNPDSHIDFSSKIDNEKGFVNLLMKSVDEAEPIVQDILVHSDSVKEGSWISSVQNPTSVNTDSEDKEDASNSYDIYIL